MTEEVEVGEKKGGFLRGTIKTVCAKGLENCLNIANVFRKGVGPNDDVVQVDVTNGPNVGPEGGKHATLMRCRGIATPHGHDGPLVEPEGRGDGSEMNIVGVHFGLKKRISHINFGPVFTACAISQDVIDAREWVGIGNGICIELAVVIDPSRQVSGVFFCDQE